MGQLALSSQTVSFIQSVVYELQHQKVTYSRLVLPAGSQELDVYIEGQPYYVKFNIHDVTTAREQVGSYLAAMHYLKEQGAAPSSYVDVRVAGRAYYR